MLVYDLSANGIESWKMIQDPRKNPDHHQNLISSSHGHAAPLNKISLKSVITSFRYFAYRHKDEYITSSAAVTKHFAE